MPTTYSIRKKKYASWWVRDKPNAGVDYPFNSSYTFNDLLTDFNGISGGATYGLRTKP